MGSNLIDPFHDAVNVETMCARAPDDWTVITRNFAIRTTSVKSHTTNTACVVVSDPLPVETKKSQEFSMELLFTKITVQQGFVKLITRP